MLKNTLMGTLALGLLLAGCGSSSDSSGNDAGAAGTGAGTGAAAGTGGSGGSTAGTGSEGGTGGIGTQFTCDTTITSVDKCGTETCTAPTGQAATMCQVTCCTSDNKCGQKNASTQAAGTPYADCSPPAVEDPRCAGGPSSFGTPCCTTMGTCGVSFMGSSCFDTTAVLGGTAVKCDEAGGDADAGTN